MSSELTLRQVLAGLPGLSYEELEQLRLVIPEAKRKCLSKSIGKRVLLAEYLRWLVNSGRIQGILVQDRLHTRIGDSRVLKVMHSLLEGHRLEIQSRYYYSKSEKTSKAVIAALNSALSRYDSLNKLFVEVVTLPVLLNSKGDSNGRQTQKHRPETIPGGPGKCVP